MSENVHIVSINEQKIMKQTIILTVLLSILFVGINYYLHPDFDFSILRFLIGIIIFIVVSLLLVVVNEILNLLGYRYRCKVKPESLSLSIHLEKGLIYSTTSEKITNGQYQSVFLTSFMITGVIPLAIAFSLGNYALLLASASFIAGGLANFIGMFKLRKFPDDALVKDVPAEFNVYVYLDEKKHK
ncbi:putative zincin peptidase [Ureibacillus xyleni]|uniref:Putative zincin peptidase n=1 Tax=Ureibacillus xyleni TaxID=614648 RepID=A0A285SLC9_9BACL|nr:metalloprotease family protein [Ureibacillus xyleni]SOC08140.1 putative zincin peptidase [Ureibacillus xyleni]